MNSTTFLLIYGNLKMNVDKMNAHDYILMNSQH